MGTMGKACKASEPEVSAGVLVMVMGATWWGQLGLVTFLNVTDPY